MENLALSSLFWPRPLPPGHTIGLCSPAAPSSPEAIGRGVAALEARAYHVVVAPHAAAQGEAGTPYLAGSDAQRLSDLNGLIRDPDVDLILCQRGGYGTMRILDDVDYVALREQPKAIVGYSDITALSLAVAARAGVVSFSGIMVTAGHGFGEETLDPFSEASFWQMVGNAPFPRVAHDDTVWTVHRAAAPTLTGPLYPGCLTLLTSLVGTPYLPDLTGAILVIEDVHEALYAFDRALAQLRLAGILDALAGILIGSFNGVDDAENDLLAAHVPELVVTFTPPHVAVVSGVSYGHIPRRLTLPVGAIATVDLNAQTFTFNGNGK